MFSIKKTYYYTDLMSVHSEKQIFHEDGCSMHLGNVCNIAYIRTTKIPNYRIHRSKKAEL
jgi:hypothetical protein